MTQEEIPPPEESRCPDCGMSSYEPAPFQRPGPFTLLICGNDHRYIYDEESGASKRYDVPIEEY